MPRNRKPPPLPPIADAITQPVQAPTRTDETPSAENLTDVVRPQIYRIHFNRPMPLVVPHRGVGQLVTEHLEWADAGVWIVPPELPKRTFVPFDDVLMIVEL